MILQWYVDTDKGTFPSLVWACLTVLPARMFTGSQPGQEFAWVVGAIDITDFQKPHPTRHCKRGVGLFFSHRSRCLLPVGRSATKQAGPTGCCAPSLISSSRASPMSSSAIGQLDQEPIQHANIGAWHIIIERKRNAPATNPRPAAPASCRHG